MSKNIHAADCGFDPHVMDRFKMVSVDEINDVYGFDLKGKKHVWVSLAKEKSDVSIEDFLNMKDGMEYRIVSTNATTTSWKLLFPTNTVYSNPITPAAGDSILYKFFKIGKTIYCERLLFNVANKK